ncbi:MAG: hypothetical protein ABF628_02975 [Acetobacter orientalis]|uniref:hypothetical protein n=1 Tax=Acetobacter orientalis TaxID=146474 RepID=UPI0039EC8EC9
MSNLKYQHRTAEIMGHYTRGMSMNRISQVLKIPRMCVCRVIQQHKKSVASIAPVAVPAPLPTVNVLELERKDGALVRGHALIERSLWAGLEHWRGLH